jgi:hypothetical protein
MHTESQTSTPSLSDILKGISDDKSQVLFNCIALSTGQQSILIKQMHLSTKQYYARISGLTNAGLIKRNQGEHSLTSLGRVVYKVNTTIENEGNRIYSVVIACRVIEGGHNRFDRIFN